MLSCPNIMLVSCQTYRQLSGWNLPPLASRTFVAHCIISVKIKTSEKRSRQVILPNSNWAFLPIGITPGDYYILNDRLKMA